MERQGERDFCLTVLSPSDHIDWGCARPNPVAWNSIYSPTWVSRTQILGPSYEFPAELTGSWIGSKSAGIVTNIFMWYSSIASRVLTLYYNPGLLVCSFVYPLNICLYHSTKTVCLWEQSSIFIIIKLWESSRTLSTIATNPVNICLSEPNEIPRGIVESMCFQ